VSLTTTLKDGIASHELQLLHSFTASHKLQLFAQRSCAAEASESGPVVFEGV